MRILVVEDEPNLNEVITKRLKSENYAVDCCFDGITAEEFLAVAQYDVVVLDVMLPNKDGLSVLEDMRRKNDNTPVLLLTAKAGVDDRIRGLDIGADDYLIKPFAFGELLARLRSLTRRPVGSANNVYELAGLIVDTDAHTVSRDGISISLSSKEFAILENLIQNKGIVLSREKIEQNAWDFSFEGGSNVVDVYIRYLRKKVDDGYPIKLIHTVRGTGYVLKVEE